MNKELIKDIKQILITTSFVVLSIIVSNAELKTAFLLLAYMIVSIQIFIKAYKSLKNGGFLDENFLMAIASIGAFLIGEQIEAVAIILFYKIGVAFEDYSINRSRKSIKEAMSIAPDYANLKTKNTVKKVSPQDVKIDDIIVVKPGEKVPLDGVIITGSSTLDTSALTGESLPLEVEKGTKILSGSVNINGLLEVKVTSEFQTSTVSKILELVEDATAKKSSHEKFITKFAKIYTPIVVGLAFFIAFIVPIFAGDFKEWVYKALIFLVVSCPCALVVSVPLSFFGGIGGASKKGILVKGSNYLQILAKVKSFVFDKTGTLTKGEFALKNIVNESFITKDEILKLAAYAQVYSTHPIGISIVKAYNKKIDENSITKLEEVPGNGINATIFGKNIKIGSKKFLSEFELPNLKETASFISVDGKFAGYLTFEDKLRDNSFELIKWLKDNSIKTAMLTGDRLEVALNINEKLKIDEVYAELLPADKLTNLEKIINKNSKNGTIAYIGDGINDAPVLARADVGISMLGTDAAMEASDIVLMDNNISKIKTAIKISKKTINIAYQNIIFAIGIKVLVMILAIFGFANIWMAIFADVGVTILAIFNSFRTFYYAKKL
ncbi:heavy metal translocating P-type ATPase [Campylobacter ureolyticus]|uniref:P-type Zn(2+) transporter n=1 Tax=Campylobacter ureolyticus TaxID=827 RepID=A0A9Q4KLI6_9BACT|nr:heavy metal translocating P-type ATPase [Campylobacter ureolyticus]MCZ6104873.1 heavy metal translocating P-type ATPase [Campylobacter ureolyticus]MCZ6111193.1 heavy metal translocating P-type ATPase [Campylobacter ureolyticus]MCZ6157488.1 heavy metal translocating P-type ATPase [Campylobacter ureolyticus]MCZ6160172.1 heavy metal translocating P-type ATPase [Campylobacter ureolyticus]MCZ6163911.1 heavy metal translocating P-type ATPase [Campylobacter ureolyticus]